MNKLTCSFVGICVQSIFFTASSDSAAVTGDHQIASDWLWWWAVFRFDKVLRFRLLIRLCSAQRSFSHSEVKWCHLVCLYSGSASFRGASEGQLTTKSVPVWRLQSRCSFCSLFLEDARLRSFVASYIQRSFVRPKKTIEREKMATSRGVDCHFRGPRWQKSWRKGKKSGDATRKCSKG